MIAPFTLRDLPLLKQLQKNNTSLCPVEALTRPRSPLWTALTSRLTFDQVRAFTLVLNEAGRNGKQLQGFAQVAQSATRPEMRIQCLAPCLDACEAAQTVWNRLLNHVVAMAGERGLLRIYACTPDGGEETEVLLSTGFSVYTREEVFLLAPDTHPQAIIQRGIRPEQSTDLWEINRLYWAVAPHLVRQAESLIESKNVEWTCGAAAWSQGEGFVLKDRSDVIGYGHLTPGRIGHWLNILVHPNAYDQVDKLLDYGLALLNYYPPYPVYCAVREYQGGIRAPLEDRGFEPLSVQCHLVRHTAVRVKESALGLVPALEKQVKAPTTTVSPSEGP